ncbi:ATP-binding protein [Dactylosporangium sp. NPDC005555]|uniref:ATP-binding protein n=1 Tax=Dactylosporangium sp. NPDC005555 TaxID=3154889 RepID=UPI0033A19096
MAGTARTWARQILPGLLEHPAGDELADDVELLLSELCTNAVRHGDGLDAVHLHCTPTALRVTVNDRSPVPPTPQDHTATDPDVHLDHGRGLLLVQAIATLWGVEHHDGNGKGVWFELPIHRPPTAAWAWRLAGFRRP